MVTRFGVGLDSGVTPRSQQGHLKVTGRSNQLQIGKNTHFFLASLQFNSLEMSMVVETHLDPSMEMYQNTPRGYMVNTGAGGVIPHQITLISPLSHMTDMDQITLKDCHV